MRLKKRDQNKSSAVTGATADPPAGIERAVRLFQSGQAEDGVRALLQWPDQACSREGWDSHRALWADLCTRHGREPVEELICRFLEALCAYRAGLSSEAGEALHRFLDRLGDHPKDPGAWALRAAACLLLAHSLRRIGDLKDAPVWARRAAIEAHERGASWLEGTARLTLGRVLGLHPGERARARAALNEAHRLLAAVSPPDALGVAHVRAAEARLALDAGSAFVALSLLREARAAYGRCHYHRGLARTRIDQGWAHIHLRSTRVARHYGEEALAQLRQLGDGRGALRAQKLLARVALEDADFEDALRRFLDLQQAAEALQDDTMRAEALVGAAQAAFQLGRGGSVSRWMKQAEALVADRPWSFAALQWQALDAVRTVRRRQFSEAMEKIRRLRGLLRERDMPRLTSESLALSGFELARQGRLREAAPVLEEALRFASQPDAVAWTEQFMENVARVALRQWIASLVSEIHAEASLAERYESLRICAVAGLHDVKNLATSAYAELELMAGDMEAPPPELLSSKETAFRAGRLAADVEQQIIDDRTQILLHPAPVEVEAVLAPQRDAISWSTVLKGCTLELQPELPKALADDRYIARVLGNLFSNAEKYAPGSHITLTGRLREHGKQREILVGFGDNGPGVDPEDAEILFNAFKDPNEYRQKRANHGTGFGLYYCKLVMEAHGGHIWVDSKPGQGATFYFTLPAASE